MMIGISRALASPEVSVCVSERDVFNCEIGKRAVTSLGVTGGVILSRWLATTNQRGL